MKLQHDWQIQWQTDWSTLLAEEMAKSRGTGRNWKVLGREERPCKKRELMNLERQVWLRPWWCLYLAIWVLFKVGLVDPLSLLWKLLRRNLNGWTLLEGWQVWISVPWYSSLGPLNTLKQNTSGSTGQPLENRQIIGILDNQIFYITEILS